MTRNTFILFILLVFSGYSMKAQNYQSIQEVNTACTQLGFIGNEEAEIAVDRILDEIGLARNFMIIECPDINNAVAKNLELEDGNMERFILYDGEFFSRINEKASNDWAATSILAHEIGHHLSGHSLNNAGSSHRFELEADEFSGFVLAKMGATLEEAQSALATLKYEKATYTHPAKKDRLASVEKGWNRAIGKMKPPANIEEEKVVDFFTLEKQPIYSGCPDGSNAELQKCFSQNVGRLVASNFNTDIAKENGLAAGKYRVLLQFTVNQNGYISKVTSRAPHPALEKEAVRIIRMIPKMKPGEVEGKPVSVAYGLPITVKFE